MMVAIRVHSGCCSRQGKEFISIKARLLLACSEFSMSKAVFSSVEWWGLVFRDKWGNGRNACLIPKITLGDHWGLLEAPDWSGEPERVGSWMT